MVMELGVANPMGICYTIPTGKPARFGVTLMDDLDDLNNYLSEATAATRAASEKDKLAAKLRLSGKHMTREAVHETHRRISALSGVIEAARWQVTGHAIFWRQTVCGACGAASRQFESIGQLQESLTPSRVKRTIRVPEAWALQAITEEVIHAHTVPCCEQCYDPPASQTAKLTVVKELP